MFLDVVENVNILVNNNGQIVRSDVVGALKMRTYLRYVVLCTSEVITSFHYDKNGTMILFVNL